MRNIERGDQVLMEELIDSVTGASVYDLFEEYGKKQIHPHCDNCFINDRNGEPKKITECVLCLTGILGKWKGLTWEQWKKDTKYEKKGDELELWKDLDSWAYLLMSKDETLRASWEGNMQYLWNKVIRGIAKEIPNRERRRRNLGIPVSKEEALIKLTHGWTNAFIEETKSRKLSTSEVICTVLSRMGWMPPRGKMHDMCSSITGKEG
ncbi:hypothetical protein C922_04589 [Plasmodium inui San Antonio 1]|uniref:Uncharacterized protein n=1 Tax=Plasmodium inui San Antonio 1 TaxID=1237626 RepID=W7A7K7_9APIC|nr:hypothetical protein C922_04589 [Plasmodium inui San Antonio 1]EUD65074.1 hypothetical protein C922_04589 [Plasmodium inui San Antonio 1]